MRSFVSYSYFFSHYDLCSQRSAVILSLMTLMLHIYCNIWPAPLTRHGHTKLVFVPNVDRINTVQNGHSFELLFFY